MTSWKDKLALTAQRNRQEIVKAKLDRREMMRLGLLTAGGSLILKSGLSSRAFASGGGGADDGSLTNPDVTLANVPPSPPARPWAQPMTRLTVKTPIDYHKMKRCGPPDGTTPIDGATKRINHQYFSYDAKADKYGANPAQPLYNFAPQKFYELSMQETHLQLHPDYGTTKVWGFDGLVPGPLIKANYGEPILVRFYNDLPSVKIPQAFGIAEMTTHLHNAHTPSESDGNPVNFFNSINDPNAINPLGFKDQHYPNVLAGFTDPTFGSGFSNPASQGNPLEALSSLWYHDHHLDFTAQNVYKGMFGCYNLFDSHDTGDETTGLRLPSGEFDIPIFFNDFLFDKDCQQVFDLFNLDGILGDRFCANGLIQPTLEVAARRYRFRLYAPGPSRWWQFALWDGKNYFPFWQIASDGNLLPQAIQTTDVRVAVAERVDILVDFSKVPKGTTRLYLVNRLEQVNARGPTGKVLTPGTPIIQINIGNAAPDYSVDPTNPKTPLVMRQLPDADFTTLLALAAKATPRSWQFQRGNGGWMVNGKFFDENVVSAAIPVNSPETWTLQNPGGSWRHPVHIHFEEHRTLSRNGVLVKPNVQNSNASADYARKDVIELNNNEEVRLFMRFRDMKGRYVMHCHNVVHEDHAMMIRWDIV
jgi:FtsP/CotA-like multicopper oxidase with cupredoxin domain